MLNPVNHVNPVDPQDPEVLMRVAFELARRGLGRVAPNPPVGALLVTKDLKVAEGWHAEYGGPHAEAACLAAARAAGIDTRGATMVVTLEPCGHQGKTPPCSQAIIDAGISTLIYSHPDPHPVTRGKGLQQLEDAGIEVIGGVLQADGARLLAPYLCHVQRGRPLVTVKWAMTLDGRIASATGDSKWITSDETRRWTRERRGHHSA
ncbi:MAG: riboflavin biosynthesis protein RibD, partial [Planctomycetia bacterium TMED53]